MRQTPEEGQQDQEEVKTSGQEMGLLDWDGLHQVISDARTTIVMYLDASAIPRYHIFGDRSVIQVLGIIELTKNRLLADAIEQEEGSDA